MLRQLQMRQIRAAVGIRIDALGALARDQRLQAAQLLLAAAVGAREVTVERAALAPEHFGADRLIESQRRADARHVQIGAGGHQQQSIALASMRRDGCQRLAIEATAQDPRHVALGPAIECRTAQAAQRRVDQCALDVAMIALEWKAQRCRYGQ